MIAKKLSCVPDSESSPILETGSVLTCCFTLLSRRKVEGRSLLEIDIEMRKSFFFLLYIYIYGAAIEDVFGVPIHDGLNSLLLPWKHFPRISVISFARIGSWKANTRQCVVSQYFICGRYNLFIFEIVKE
jgi:hypothetical protein